MHEGRVYVGWKNGCFVTTAGPNLEFQRQLNEMVKDMGPPDTVEFRPADKGFIIGDFDFDEVDPSTDIIPMRQELPVQLENEEDDESAEYCAPV
mgnify:FL=1|jgi:hypothetical protein